VAADVVTPPTLIDGDEDVFDLGEYAEDLATKKLLAPDDIIRGTIQDLLANESHEVSYTQDDSLADGNTTRAEVYGPEFKVFSGADAKTIVVAGAPLASRQNDPAIWNEIVKSDDWVTIRKSDWISVGG